MILIRFRAYWFSVISLGAEIGKRARVLQAGRKVATGLKSFVGDRKQRDIGLVSRRVIMNVRWPNRANQRLPLQSMPIPRDTNKLPHCHCPKPRRKRAV